MTTATVPANGFRRVLRSIHIPPVYFFLILIFIGGGLLDQVFADGQIFSNPAIMLNIIVRSVALGIVAVGQSLVIIGASIDLSVAYTISITAIMSSYIMVGKTENVPMAILGVFGIGALIGLANGLIDHKTACQSLYRHPGHQPDRQGDHQCLLLKLYRLRSEEF